MDKPAPTTEQLKEQWNAFAPEFARVLTRQTDVSAFQLLTLLQLYKEDVRSVVEVGCGAGGGTQLLASLMRPGAKAVALDLTPAFLDIARKRLEGQDVEFKEGSAEALPLDSASFDRYAANFVLHLVTDPEQMLREARRVLRDGTGVAAFSVWGRPENSPFFTLLPAIQKELGIGAEPTVRSNFHLSLDPEKVKKMAIDAGFTRTQAWYSVVPIEASNTAEVMEKYTASPQMKKLLASLDEEKRNALLDRLAQVIEEQYYALGKPLTTETLFLVAYA